MLANLRTMLSAGGDLFRSEGTILAERLRRIALWSGIFAAAGLVLVAATLALCVAATAALASEIGWIAAVAVAGACAAALSAAALVSIKRTMIQQLRRSEMPLEPRTRSMLAKQEIVDALPGGEAGDASTGGQPDGRQRGDAPGESDDDLAAKVTRFIADHPAEIAGGAVAVLGLIGPARSLRMLSKGVMLAGIAQSISKQMGVGAGASPAAQQAARDAAASAAGRASAE